MLQPVMILALAYLPLQFITFSKSDLFAKLDTDLFLSLVETAMEQGHAYKIICIQHKYSTIQKRHNKLNNHSDQLRLQKFKFQH
jgi:hypothetical protein